MVMPTTFPSIKTQFHRSRIFWKLSTFTFKIRAHIGNILIIPIQEWCIPYERTRLAFMNTFANVRKCLHNIFIIFIYWNTVNLSVKNLKVVDVCLQNKSSKQESIAYCNSEIMYSSIPAKCAFSKTLAHIW